MYRVKIVLLSFLALFAMSSVATSTASAELQGPWYKQVKGGKQIKLALNSEQQVKGANEGSMTLKGKMVGSAIVFKCGSAVDDGNIWNGLHQGEGNTTFEFGSCTIAKAITCIGARIEIVPFKTYSELQWKYAGNASELKEVGQQKIYSVFAPTAEPVGGEASLTKINILKSECESLSGEFPVEAVGTPAMFVDQNGESHRIAWGMGPVVEPQNTDVVTNHLTWAFPNVTELHSQGTQTKAKLSFGGAPLELEGKIKVELNGGEAFGVFNL